MYAVILKSKTIHDAELLIPLDLHVPQGVRKRKGHRNRGGQGRLPGGGEDLELGPDYD